MTETCNDCGKMLKDYQAQKISYAEYIQDFNRAVAKFVNFLIEIKDDHVQDKQLQKTNNLLNKYQDTFKQYLIESERL